MDHRTIRRIEEALQKNDQALAVRIAQEFLDMENNTPLNIAITGETGSGKSTFVSAFRCKHKGAAPTGCVETTTVGTPYHHPNYPNVTLWDLPGVGTPNFPAHKYSKMVELETFDFFIIISDNNFRENDMKLTQEIQKMGKKLYFVRSKIDNDLRAAERGQSFNAEKTLARIRTNCIQGLQQHCINTPQVFLVSSFEIHHYDFSCLHETLKRELPAHKRDALLFAVLKISQEIINRKKKAFQVKIKYIATCSGAVAGVPVPGVSALVDTALLVNVVKKYIVGFGLDAQSLQKLSESTGVPLSDLRVVMRSPLTSNTITPELIMTMILQLGNLAALIAAEEWSRFIPFFGIPASMGLSFTTTYSALNAFLSELAEDAQRVFKRVLIMHT